jgi:hypothetical protein
MAYLVLAYPEVRDEDFKQIQDYRKNNDEYNEPWKLGQKNVKIRW